MIKPLITLAAGSAILLVSCEPLPVHPEHRRRPKPERHHPNDDRNQPYDEDDGPTDVPPTRDDYPVAERTANPNHVISPYAPYNVINVEGFRSGQLARDPSNQKVFRIP